MEPTWMRAAYLRVLSLVGVVFMGYGALTAATGAVHATAPRTGGANDPFTRIVRTAIDSVDAVLADAKLTHDLSARTECSYSSSSSDSFDGNSFDTGSSNVEPDCTTTYDDSGIKTARKALRTVRHELDHQTRDGAVNGLLRGLVFFGVGAFITRKSWRRAEALYRGT